MAVTTTASVVEYTSNGSSTSYSVPFPFLDDDHIRVSKIDPSDVETVLSLGGDYTVTGGDPSGAVTLNAAVTSGWTVRILRVVPLTQPVEFRTQGPFSPATWEKGLDRCEMQIQQLNDGVILASSYIYDHGNQPGGSLHAAVTSTTNGFATPAMLAAINGLPTSYRPITYVPTWGEILSKPTTLTGYGVKLEADGLYKGIGYVPAWSEITSKPTTLAGYGITDGATTSQVVSLGGDIADHEARITVLEGFDLDTRVAELEGNPVAPTIYRAVATWNTGTSKWDLTGNVGFAAAPVTPGSAGICKMTFLSAAANTNYVVSVTTKAEGAARTSAAVLNKTTGSFDVYLFNSAGSLTSAISFDVAVIV